MEAHEWEDWRENLAETLEAFGTVHMPFGKYGPQNYPPDGLPLYQLPAEYLIWFKQKGFPRGRLGQLMEALHGIHATGAEAVLAPLRKSSGNPHPLRKSRPRTFDFSDDENRGGDQTGFRKR